MLEKIDVLQGYKTIIIVAVYTLLKLVDLGIAPELLEQINTILVGAGLVTLKLALDRQ